MATIATLTIDLVGKSSKLNAELRKANKNTKSWSDKTRKMANAGGKAMAGFAVAGVAALTALYAKNAAFIDQQAKTADRLGITTEALTGLQHAASINGATNDELTNSLKRMQQGLGQVAQTGTGEAKYALDGLGLSIKDIQGLAPEEQFKLIADRLNTIEDQSQKVYIAQSLMGKSGVKMINVMAQGSEGIQGLIQEADDLGITFSRIDAAKVELANDAFERASKSTQSFGQALATETAPIIGELSNMFTDSAKEAGGFGELAQKVIFAVAKGIGYLGDSGRGLKLIFYALRQAMAETWNMTFKLVNGVAQIGGGFLETLGFDASGVKKMQEFSESFEASTDSWASQLTNLANEPLPSEKIGNWIADAQFRFQQAAREQSKKSKTSLEDLLVDKDADGDGGEVDEKAKGLVDKMRSTYQEIFDEQLIMEGKEIELEERRYQRKLAELDREYEMLREKNLITAEIEDEHRLAREQLELQHKDRLTEVDTQRNDTMMASYDSLLSTMGGYFDGMEGHKAKYASAAMSIGQTLLDEEKRSSIQSIWTNTYDTAMKAYNALASIPYIGPVLGAAAAGTVITAGTLYAAKAAGVTSFEGGGFTGHGPRIGGVDGKGGMPAIVHPNETITDHTLSSGMQYSSPQYNIKLNVMGGGSQSFWDEQAGMIKKSFARFERR